MKRLLAHGLDHTERLRDRKRQAHGPDPDGANPDLTDLDHIALDSERTFGTYRKVRAAVLLLPGVRRR